LSARILRLANSPYYGLSKQVVSLQESVVLLGMRSVRNLAMVAATYPWMVRPLKGYALGPKEMWTHSFGVAIGSQLVAQKAKLAHHETVFLAGLLHDLGKVALSIWLEGKIAAMINLAARDNLTFDQAEQRVLGYDHTEVGEHLARLWNLPDSLVAPIRFHHWPNAMETPDLTVDCVHIGDYLTMTMGFGLGGDGLNYAFHPETLDRLHLSLDDLDDISDIFVTRYEACEALFTELAAA
jgi:putative nucleotidyltransferase with HDIG domain